MKKGLKRYKRICQRCSKKFTARRADKIYCTKFCRSAVPLSKDQKYDRTSTGAIGAANELRAAVFLMRRGYEVFRALSPTCSCDLIVLKDGLLKRVEVRTGRRATNGTSVYAKRTHHADLLVIVIGSKIVLEPAS